MQDITVQELKDRMNKQEELFIVDVREPWEYQEFNIGAKLMPLGSFQTAVNELSDWKDKEVILHCKSGGRSGAAKNFLMAQGFTNVRNLLGGMMAWQTMSNT